MQNRIPLLLVALRNMILPSGWTCKPEIGSPRKRFVRLRRSQTPHAQVNQIIMLPDFGQSAASLDCDHKKTALARSFRHRIPQPPAPRGRQDRV